MSPRPILRWPHACLKAPAAEVEAVTDEIRAIWDDMIDTMEAMPGVGLAAPQIGIGLALAVVDASDTRGQAVRLANPRIVWVSEETGTHPEASPCLPGVSAEVLRPARVRVAFLDETGSQQDRWFDGLWATSIQHQIDHLAGRMFFDNLSRLKRERLLKRARKVSA
jgi:peptide deformylase